MEKFGFKSRLQFITLNSCDWIGNDRGQSFTTHSLMRKARLISISIIRTVWGWFDQIYFDCAGSTDGKLHNCLHIVSQSVIWWFMHGNKRHHYFPNVPYRWKKVNKRNWNVFLERSWWQATLTLMHDLVLWIWNRITSELILQKLVLQVFGMGGNNALACLHVSKSITNVCEVVHIGTAVLCAKC